MTFTPEFQHRNRIEQVRLAAYTTMRIGGPATLVTLESREDLPELLGQPHRWLGHGANLLIGDDGVPEPVVRLGAAFAGMELDLLCSYKINDAASITLSYIHFFAGDYLDDTGAGDDADFGFIATQWTF